MRRSAARIAIVLIAMAMTAVGMVGALSYARDYNLHRGFGTVVRFRRAGTGRLVRVAFFSPALRRNADYLVYLPPHYSRARRYPVYYLLHGMPGQPRVFVDIANMDVRLDNQLSLGHARPMILVYPDGRIGASTFSDSEWANTRSGNFESYVIDVMHNVDHHFSTLPHRRDRVIAGFSAGAYGALNIALHHLADFANVEVWSGYFTQTRTGVFAHAGRAALAANSPLEAVTHLTRRLAVYPLRAFLFAGRDDSSSRQLLPMARALRTRGARVAYHFYPGGHDWSVWYPRLNQMLNLASWDIAHPPRRLRRPPTRMTGLGRAPRLIAGRARHAAWGPRRPFVETITPLPRLTPRPAVVVHARPHRHRSGLRLIGVLLLALASAALINLGFVLQHRGRAQDLAAGHSSLAHAMRNRAWLAGQVLGWIRLRRADRRRRPGTADPGPGLRGRQPGDLGSGCRPGAGPAGRASSADRGGGRRRQPRLAAGRPRPPPRAPAARRPAHGRPVRRPGGDGARAARTHPPAGDRLGRPVRRR